MNQLRKNQHILLIHLAHCKTWDFLQGLFLLTLSDPPENIELSDLVITLEEGSSAESVMCTAEAYPEASYAWEVNGGDVVATDNLLFFDEGVSRDQGGDYTCVAKNRHGRAEMVTRIEVICELSIFDCKLIWQFKKLG